MFVSLIICVNTTVWQRSCLIRVKLGGSISVRHSDGCSYWWCHFVWPRFVFRSLRCNPYASCHWLQDTSTVITPLVQPPINKLCQDHPCITNATITLSSSHRVNSSIGSFPSLNTTLWVHLTGIRQVHVATSDRRQIIICCFPRRRPLTTRKEAHIHDRPLPRQDALHVHTHVV